MNEYVFAVLILLGFALSFGGLTLIILKNPYFYILLLSGVFLTLITVVIDDHQSEKNME